MKDIRARLTDLLKTGYCTPRISGLAKALNEPPATIHYNIKQLEKSTIRGYKAVFNYKEIDQGFCAFVLMHISPEDNLDPAKLPMELAAYPQVESVDIVMGNWDVIIKVRMRDVDEYYQFLKNVLLKKKPARIQTVASTKQIKDEFVIIKDK